MRTLDKIQMTALEIELTLRALKPYSKDRDIDSEGKELRRDRKTGEWIALEFHPFWSVPQ